MQKQCLLTFTFLGGGGITLITQERHIKGMNANNAGHRHKLKNNRGKQPNQFEEIYHNFLLD